MHPTLRIGEFPEPAVIWIPVQSVPPAIVPTKLDQIVMGKLLNPSTVLIANRESIGY
jgi:hypothetical protein